MKMLDPSDRPPLFWIIGTILNPLLMGIVGGAFASAIFRFLLHVEYPRYLMPMLGFCIVGLQLSLQKIFVIARAFYS
jgi:hypothetical protein